jgi:glycosyltransferase involved in cell wall biosynthesis
MKMELSFGKDVRPGKGKILFIGLPQSSHTRAWIDLLADQEFNVRLFGLPTGMPPAEWKVKTYLTLPNAETRRNPYHKQLYLPGRAGSLQKRISGFLRVSPDERRLAHVMRDWEPDIVHTLGLDPASYFFYAAQKRLAWEKTWTWLVQIRGGSDLALARHEPASRERIRQALAECDQIIFDNSMNAGILEALGVPSSKFAPIAPVPGSGGIDAAAPVMPIPPSRRERMILWPKAYECRWSKALPVLAAIRDLWRAIQPCEIYMLATTPEVSDWVKSWPEEIRIHCHVSERIAREDLLALLRRARIMLAPSLIDGIPNSLYEAMACGAFPIVSPLESIATIVRHEENVLFARNLYPDEIAAALLRAMTDDALVDNAAQINAKLVAVLADRKSIRCKVAEYYQELLAQAGSCSPTDRA